MAINLSPFFSFRRLFVKALNVLYHLLRIQLIDDRPFFCGGEFLSCPLREAASLLEIDVFFSRLAGGAFDMMTSDKMMMKMKWRRRCRLLMKPF